MNLYTNEPSSSDNAPQKAILLGLFFFLLALGCLAFLLLSPKEDGKYIADIYQNGTLLCSIPLYAQKEIYHFEIKGENGCVNTVEVSPGAIAIISANCPDQICVHQGAIHNSLLPITCLPNRVVIQLRAVDDDASPPSQNADIISY